MVIAFKEKNKVYIVKTRSTKHYTVRHPQDDLDSDNTSIYKYPNHATLVNSYKPRIIDIIKDRIEYSKKLNFDYFYINDYQDIKTILRYNLILNTDYTNPEHLVDQDIIYAKGYDFIVIHQFKQLIWGDNFYSNAFNSNLKASFSYHKHLPVEKRIVTMLLNLMDHTSNNYFPIHITNTKTQEITSITLKEALCQYDSL
jgi:hypothetical protein